MSKTSKIKFFALLLCTMITMICCTGKAYAAGIINTQSAPEEIVAISAKQIEFTDGIARITTGGRYILSGEHEGQILIEATRRDLVQLILDGATLNNPNGQAIFAPRSLGVELILADGTVNNISDGVYKDEENNAAIFIQHDLIISGTGVLNVTGNYHHGIRTQDFLTINGGTFQITAAGDALRGRDGVIINDGTFTLKAEGDGIQSNNDSNPEYGYITINGGTFDIRASDDGIQGETNVTINGGNFQITAADDGITSNGPVLITGGDINIANCYEGIEGLNVTITGGNISINARDDGINARDGNAVTDFRGRPMMRGPVNPDIYVRITGGTINVNARGDGIDSNNNIFLEGGTLLVSGPSMGMEGAVDLDGVFLITGGKLVTAGSVLNVSRQSTQPFLYVTFNQQFPAGVNIEIRDAKNNTLLNYAALTSFRISAFTSPDFIIGETYSVFINNQKTTDVTLGSVITSSGGNNTMGRGGFNDFNFRGDIPSPGDFRNMPGFPGDIPSPGDRGGRRMEPPSTRL
ncbi:MAG: carbohydrate-binding domain-containing protein [Treponema sp.]|nr:carbohydrate-binding domain-containing protein [Treponema sp.]